MSDGLDDIVKSLEDAYWLTVHNKASDHVRRLTFSNYQMMMAQFYVQGKEPTNEYKKIHQHFYNQECLKRKIKYEDDND